MDIYNYFPKNRIEPIAQPSQYVNAKETDIFFRGEFPERCFKYKQECIKAGFKEEETFNELEHNIKN